jgi:hypothetical protein
MPAHQSLRSDDHDGPEDRWEPSIQLDQEQAIAVREVDTTTHLRCSTVNCCLSAAFSASSRLLDLKSEETRLKNRKISPTIVADGKRFSHQIKWTKFSAHTDGIFGKYKEPYERTS